VTFEGAKHAVPISLKLFANKKTALALILVSLTVLSTVAITLVWSSGDSWASKAPMQVARSGLGVAAVNGKIYAIGGVTSSGFVPSSPASAVYAGKTPAVVVGSNEEYDPATDTWTFRAAMPTPRAVFAIAVYQNKIYCIGGKTSSGYTGVNEVYDPATNTWETKTPMPTAKAFLQANVVNGKIYLIGGDGLNEAYSFLKLNEVYDPATDTWITKEPMPSATFFGYASAVFDNKIYIIGSVSGSFLEIYDPETDIWSSGTSPPLGGVAAGATTGILAPKCIYVLDSENVGVYDPANDSWSLGADAPTSRYNFGVAVVNDTLYVIGGHTYSLPGDYAPIAVNEQYTPIGYGTPDSAYQSPSPLPIYAAAASAAAIIIIIITAVALKKRHKKNTS
jgi:N-acetylneuraminic acid mutarotase